MKRNISFLLAIMFCVIAVLPFAATAEHYVLSGTDISLYVDDTMWYVFTRDNIQNNAELEELGVSYEEIHDILYNNEAYMDAVLYFEDGEYIEFFVRKSPLDTGVANLSNYDDSDVSDFAKELAKEQGADDYSVYQSRYKFARLEYEDSEHGYYMCEYYTIVNKDSYALTFQSSAPYTQEDYEEIESIMSSARFYVDTSLKEAVDSDDGVGEEAVAGAVAGAVASAIAVLAKRSKKKRDEAKKTTSINSIQSE